MPSYRYVGGSQQPDLYGYLEPGDVLAFDEPPEWGDWEATSGAPTGPSATPQPVDDTEADDAEPEPGEDA